MATYKVITEFRDGGKMHCINETVEMDEKEGADLVAINYLQKIDVKPAKKTRNRAIKT